MKDWLSKQSAVFLEGKSGLVLSVVTFVVTTTKTGILRTIVTVHENHLRRSRNIFETS